MRISVLKIIQIEIKGIELQTIIDYLLVAIDEHIAG